MVLSNALNGIAIHGGNRLIMLVLSVILARSLGAQGYGTYAYALSIMSILLLISEMGIPLLLLREVAHNQSQENPGKTKGGILRAFQTVTAASVIVSLIGYAFVRSQPVEPAAFATIVSMLILMPLTGLLRNITHTLRGLGKVIVAYSVELIVVPSLLLATVILLTVFVPALLTPDIVMISNTVVSAIAIVFALVMLNRHLPFPWRTTTPAFDHKNWSRAMFTFFLIGGGNVLTQQTGILLVGWFSSVDQVAFFRVATQIGLLVAMGNQVVSGVIAPRIAAANAASNLGEIKHLAFLSARLSVASAVVIALPLIVAPEFIIEKLFGTEYLESVLPLQILVCAQVFAATIGTPGILLSMTGHEKLALRGTWVAASLYCIFGLALVPIMGMTGAAIATAIGLVAWNLIFWRYALTKIKVNSSIYQFRAFN